MIHEQHETEPTRHLAPEDAETALSAGREFARTRAQTGFDWFAMVLTEHELVIRDAIRRSGYPTHKAEAAAEAFDAGARFEWGRAHEGETRAAA